MKKLLILALTSAFVAAANADNPNQFGVASSTGLSNAEWKQDNQTVERTYTGAPIGIDEEASSPLVLSPTASFTAPDPQVKTVVEVVATFTAISDFDSLESPGDDAKTALTVANDGTNDKYYYWDGDSWEPLETEATPDKTTSVNVTIELDNSTVGATTVKFTIGNEDPVSVNLSSATTLSGLAFAGTGSLTSVDATVIPAYATTTTKKYASVSAALADSVAVNAITLHKHGDSFGTMPTGDSPLYFPINVNDNDNTARLYSFTKVGDDYQIATAADLFALKDAVANVPAARSLSYKQTANIDMTGTDAFAGIGTYDANPTNGVPFTGTYDGGGYTISNVDFTQRNYGGIFNQVNGGTIKKLTVENITCEDFSTSVNDGEWGCAIVGNAGNGAILENLVANGSFGTTSTPCTHNVAGIAIRLSEGNTRVINCTNNATLYGTYSKLGGICALTQYKIDTGAVKFEGCVNNGTITATKDNNGSKEPGVDGIAGIVAYTAGKTELKDCVNTGSFSSTYSSAAIGELVGKGGVETNGTLTDLGGNKGDATKKLVYSQSNVTGFKYATVDNGVATTVTSLAKDTTYLLEGNVAASGTPVFTLAAAGETIAFDTALGYTFAGTVAAAKGLVAPSTSGKVTTYTASTPVTVDGESTDATLLVSVPQNCYASQLINTSNRENNDQLVAYDSGNKKYYTWTYNKTNDTWDKADTVLVTGESAGIISKTPEATGYPLTRGQAVWVTRTDTNEPIKLNAVYTDDPVEVAVSIGYNLVAPALKKNATKFELSSLTVKNGSFNDKDMIVIPGAAAPINCVRKDNEWKVYRVSGTETPSGMPAGWGGIATGGKYEDAPDIPSGKGFFFVSKEEKTIEL